MRYYIQNDNNKYKTGVRLKNKKTWLDLADELWAVPGVYLEGNDLTRFCVQCDNDNGNSQYIKNNHASPTKTVVYHHACPMVMN